jgi:hypothetical protein
VHYVLLRVAGRRTSLKLDNIYEQLDSWTESWRFSAFFSITTKHGTLASLFRNRLCSSLALFYSAKCASSSSSWECVRTGLTTGSVHASNMIQIHSEKKVQKQKKLQGLNAFNWKNIMLPYVCRASVFIFLQSKPIFFNSVYWKKH